MDLSTLSGGPDISLPIILEPDNHQVYELEGSATTTPRNEEINTPYELEGTIPIEGTMGLQVPTHPIPSMQEAFAESMLESGASTPTATRNIPKTAAARRQTLLDQDVSEETHAARWRQKPGQQYHELWKLMAQISFGIYLLLNGMAKDDEQVMNILQGHVDEVDEFLETTLADFDLAQVDIDERLKFLKLPLENIEIFDAMLEDRGFRLQIVNGNERIEHVITRTGAAMTDALRDVQQGLDSCKEFTIYLAQEQEEAVWKQERPDMQKVFDAMKGNVEGWYKAYVSLQTKGNHLGVALVQLGSIVAEMDRRAGEVSRKTRFSTSTSSKSSPQASPPTSPPQDTRNSRQMRLSMSKDLPSDPNMITPAIRAALPAFQYVQDRERTPDPESQRSSSDIEPETDFILKPHTYTPVPSPNPPAAPVQEAAPAPEVNKRSSLRTRFSLKRKDVPQQLLRKEPPPQKQEKQEKQSAEDGYWGPRQRVLSVSATVNAQQREREQSLNTPPSRGLDSAYCSDFEKPSPPAATHPALLTQTYSHQSSNSRDVNLRNHNNSNSNLRAATFGPHRTVVPSPRSDQQFFRPVNANPNSPLQRPWTASPGPANPLHQHSNSSTSNLSTRSRPHHTHTPSGLGIGTSVRGSDVRGEYASAYGGGTATRGPSAMGMSVMSDITVGVDEHGKKIKKKRSAFGWLKKAFSLSEEEKREFEERRKRTERDNWVKERERVGGPRWVDGKRVR